MKNVAQHKARWRILPALFALLAWTACGESSLAPDRVPSAGGEWAASTDSHIFLLTLREYDDSSITGTGYVVRTPGFSSTFSSQVHGEHRSHPRITFNIVTDAPATTFEFTGQFTGDSTIVGTMNADSVILRRTSREIKKG